MQYVLNFSGTRFLSPWKLKLRTWQQICKFREVKRFATFCYLKSRHTPFYKHHAYPIERWIQPLQNLWPQLVCIGSLRPRRQIGHSYLLLSGGSKYSSHPSDLSSSCDKSPLANKLMITGRKKAVLHDEKNTSSFIRSPNFSANTPRQTPRQTTGLRSV